MQPSGTSANKATTPKQPEPEELCRENCSRSCGGRDCSHLAWQAWQKNLVSLLRQASMVRLLCLDRALQREHLKNFSGGWRLGSSQAMKAKTATTATTMPKIISGATN